jgi:hypothetical protein
MQSRVDPGSQHSCCAPSGPRKEKGPNLIQSRSSAYFLRNLSAGVQLARPLGGLEQAMAISLASFSQSKIRATAGVARYLRLQQYSRRDINGTTFVYYGKIRTSRD